MTESGIVPHPGAIEGIGGKSVFVVAVSCIFCVLDYAGIDPGHLENTERRVGPGQGAEKGVERELRGLIARIHHAVDHTVKRGVEGGHIV